MEKVYTISLVSQEREIWNKVNANRLKLYKKRSNDQDGGKDQPPLKKQYRQDNENQLKGAATTPTHIFTIWLLGITNFFLGVCRAPSKGGS